MFFKFQLLDSDWYLFLKVTLIIFWGVYVLVWLNRSIRGPGPRAYVYKFSIYLLNSLQTSLSDLCRAYDKQPSKIACEPLLVTIYNRCLLEECWLLRPSLRKTHTACNSLHSGHAVRLPTGTRIWNWISRVIHTYERARLAADMFANETTISLGKSKSC